MPTEAEAMTDQNDLEAPPPSVTPFQYSLLSLLIVMTIVAVACSGLFAASPLIAMLTGLFCVVTLPAVLTIAVIYGRGWLRTFGIGALFPAGASLFCAYSTGFFSVMFRFGPLPAGDVRKNLVYFLIVDFVATVAVGLLAVWTRWLVEESQKPSALRK